MFSVGDYDDFFSVVKESFRYTGEGLQAIVFVLYSERRIWY
jgi:hypothetical protein